MVKDIILKGIHTFFRFIPFSYASVIFVRNKFFIVYPDRTQRIFVMIEEEQIF